MTDTCTAQTQNGDSCQRKATEGEYCWQHSGCDKSDSTRERFDPGQICEALKKSGGVVQDAADMLGCSRMTIFRYCNRYPGVANARDEARSRLSEKARRTLEELMETEDEHVKIKAAKSALKHFEDSKAPDRKEVDHKSSDGSMSPQDEINDKELVKAAIEELASAESDSE